MNNENLHSKYIQERIESEQWGFAIAKNVTKEIERKRKQNINFISAISVLFIGGFSLLLFNGNLEILNPFLSESDAIGFFFSDEISPLYDSMYQEETISGLIEPISLFR